MELLTNILNAIGCGIKQLPQMELVEWPPYPNAPGDETEVREFLAMLMEARLAKIRSNQSCCWVMVQLTGWPVSMPDAEQQTSRLQIPSLGEMIAQPQLKAVAWQRLRLLPNAG